MKAIKTLYNRLSNSAKAALATAFFVFVSTVGTAFTGLLQEVIDAVNNGGEPRWDNFAKIAISAFITLVVAVVNYVTRKVQTKADPSAGPKY